MNGWFQQLFGFAEESYAATQAQFALEGTTLRVLANDRRFAVGSFETPTLQTLRERCVSARTGALTVHHEVIGDALELHARPENRSAMFQAASQFNCLEFADPREVPEDGITAYAEDPTQGPACALAAAAATVVRNYFAPFPDGVGQRRDRQIDNLDELAAVLGGHWDVRNGYTWSDEQRLARLRDALAQHDRDVLLGKVKIGLQCGVDVTFARRFVEPAEPTTVSQAFCSALSCGYTNVALGHWEPLATLVLDAAYEATLRAAAIDAAGGSGSGRVWLTFIGGGVFGNRREWIASAIRRALGQVRAEGLALDVRVAHYRSIDREIAAAVG